MDYNPFQDGQLPVELSNAGGYSATRFSLAKTAHLILAQLGFATDPRHKRRILSLTPPVQAAAYAQHDVLFIPLELAGVVDDSAGTALLKTLIILNKADAAPDIDILIFRSAPTSLGAINAAAALDATDVLTLLGVVSFVAADYVDAGAARIAQKRELNIILKPTTGTSLYVAGVLRTSGGTTPGSTSDYVLRFGIER